jgi:hypothetical protein
MRAVFLLGFILPGILSHSQEKRVVFDATTNNPIPFATIKVINKPKGTFANANGEFTLNVETNDTVLITSVGYKPKTIPGKEISSSVYLDPKVIILQKAIVHSGPLIRQLLLGSDTTNLDAELNWGPGSQAEFAKKIILPDSEKLYRVNRVSVRIKKHNGCFGPLLLHIYTSNPSTGVPDSEILIRQVNFDRKNTKKDKGWVNLTEDKIIWTGTSSFFVGFSWLPRAYDEKCLTTLFFMRSKRTDTYTRNIETDQYKWFNFYYPKKDESGNPSYTTIFITVDVEEHAR